MNGAMIMSRIAAPLCFSILLLSMLPASEAYPQQSEAFQPVMSARESHAKAAAGELVLIDIRSPEEWRETSVPASAHAITMHQDHKTFMMQLGTATGGMREKHVALICATGGRSAALQVRLRRAGFANVTNVAEGVLGGRNGPGWIKSGLPLRRWAPGLEAPQRK
jgi:rhodanese-related sulfurtransferase